MNYFPNVFFLCQGPLWQLAMIVLSDHSLLYDSKNKEYVWSNDLLHVGLISPETDKKGKQSVFRMCTETSNIGASDLEF